jgi:Cu+-exporting ATPase
MHRGVRQDHPGNRSKCGMALEPEMPSPEEDDNLERLYFCNDFFLPGGAPAE